MAGAAVVGRRSRDDDKINPHFILRHDSGAGSQEGNRDQRRPAGNIVQCIEAISCNHGRRGGFIKTAETQGCGSDANKPVCERDGWNNADKPRDSLEGPDQEAAGIL